MAAYETGITPPLTVLPALIVGGGWLPHAPTTRQTARMTSRRIVDASLFRQPADRTDVLPTSWEPTRTVDTCPAGLSYYVKQRPADGLLDDLGRQSIGRSPHDECRPPL